MYTPNSAQHTAFVQASLKENHKVGSYEYMNRIRRRIAAEVPEVSAYLQSGGLVDAVLNLGLRAPMDIQVSGSDIEAAVPAARRQEPAMTRSGIEKIEWPSSSELRLHVLHNNVPVAVVESVELPQLFTTITTGVAGEGATVNVPFA